jgi:hypothetical protein
MNNNYIISIPTNLKKIQSKLFLGLTKRQLIGFGIGAVIGILFFMLFKDISLDAGMYALFFSGAPMIFATIYQKDNMYVEQWIKLLIEQNNLNPSKRYYKVSKKNLKLAKERGLINEKKIKRRRPAKKNDPKKNEVR